MKRDINYRDIVLDRDSAEPLRIQLKNALLREIRAASPDQQLILMSERELAALLSISRPTAHHAYQDLINDGLVRRRPDKSLIVSSGARNKIAGSYRVIGILLPMDFATFIDNNSGNAIPYLKGLIGRASELNISCMMLQAPGSDASDRETDDFLDEHFHRLLGLVHLGAMLHPGSHGRILRRIMERREIPQICVSGHCSYKHVGAVNCAPEEAMKEACRDMLKKNISTLGIVHGSNNFPESPFIYFASVRDKLMEDIARQHGIKVVNVISAKDEESLRRMFASADHPEAIYCHNDRIAQKVMFLEQNIRGEQRCAYYAYDRNVDIPGLAHIDHHPEKIASRAVDMLVEYFEHGINPGNCDIKLPATFVPDFK